MVDGRWQGFLEFKLWLERLSLTTDHLYCIICGKGVSILILMPEMPEEEFQHGPHQRGEKECAGNGSLDTHR